MRPAALDEAARGTVLAAIVFVIVFSSVPLPVRAVTPSGYFFTMTILAPTSSPLRRLWAAIIADNLRLINIDARLVYVSFGTMAARTFGCSESNCGKTYDQGGFDAMLVSFGAQLLPDFNNILVYRSTPIDYAPKGGNFFFYHNETYNQLLTQYYNEFNATARVPIVQQAVRIVAQDRPDMPIFQPVERYGVANYINQWGDHASETSVTVSHDFQHWSVSTGDTINIAEPGQISSVNQWASGISDSFHSGYPYNPNGYLYNSVMAALQELDGRTLLNTKALASSISNTNSHHSWTVTFRPHIFQDGVNVTADDYLFAMMGSTIGDVGYVGAGTLRSLLGAYGQGMCNCSKIRFTFLNGTSDYVDNGAYSHGAAPAGFVPTSSWAAINNTAFGFTLSNTYLFTDPVLTSYAAEPMHIFEQIPFAQWNTSQFATLHTTRYVYSYNHPGQANHGGNGSGTAYGPIGDGPYYYHGYDSTTGTGTLVRWNGYWNASGLGRLGLFNIKTIHVIDIPTTNAALQAFVSGQVNFIDSNYYLSPDNSSVIDANNGHLTKKSPPDAGWQDFVVQNIHPVFGTGTATPNGQLDQAHAEVYARYVRAAISRAIPRQYIIDTFLGGSGSVGITEVCTCLAWAYPSDVNPDTYDLDLSRALLAKAGYSTPSYTVTVPVNTSIACGVSSPSPPGNLTLPSFISGTTLTMSGTFAIRPSVGNGTNGFYATLDQSTDGGASWVPVSMTLTTAGGYYSLSYNPTVTGDVSYRVLFTGIPYKVFSGFPYASPIVVESYTPPLGFASKNVTDTQFGSLIKLNIQSIGSAFQTVVNGMAASDTYNIVTALCGFEKSTNSTVSSFAASIGAQLAHLRNDIASKADLQNTIDSLNSKISSLSYIALAILLVASIVDLYAVWLARGSRATYKTRLGSDPT